ncbi:MAG: UvrD-helicase domain-containing protein, partial [Pseudomonadales bacterium]
MSTPAPDQLERDRATDIHRSVIVQAPAGSGKTSLLVSRFLKLLCVVEKPEEILAITFTRKAASEMANRILTALESAAHGHEADADASRALARSRERGWRLLEVPARLKIQTIDSLAMSLTRGLPVAAALDPGLALTENAGGLYQRAANRLLLRLYDDGPLTDEVADFLEQCGNDPARAERLLAGMLGKRDQWLEVIMTVVAAHQRTPERVAEVLETGLEALTRDVLDEVRERLDPAIEREVEALVEHAAAELGRSLDSEHARWRLAAEILTTQNGQLRRQVTRREGFSPEFRGEKARVLALIGRIADLGLGEAVANLRYLPDPSLTPEAVRRLVTAAITLALANAELDATFRQARMTDFTSLILNARAALGDALAPSELALALDYRIHHVLVDEFQDTSVSQFALFERLLRGWNAGDGNTFFAVGDPMQSIYRFRDADVGLFYRAWNQGIGDVPLTPVLLSSNFRADARLVRWTNHAFERILGDQEDPVLGRIAYRPATPTVPAAGDRPAVTLRRYESDADQVQGIADHVERLLSTGDESVALLVRSRNQLTELIRVLRGRGISWHANDIDPLLDKPAVRDLLSLVGVLSDPWDRLSWFSVLRAPFVGLILADLQALADIEHFPSLLERVGQENGPADLGEGGRRRLERLGNAWRHANRLLHEAPLRSVVETFWLELGGADAYDDPAALAHATRLLEIVDALDAEALQPQALEQAARNLFASDITRSRLEILTVHKAKGLEFDHVLLPFLERRTRIDEPDLLLWRPLPEGLVMGLRDDDGPYQWLARENRHRERHEQQRLLYVACTRARRSLTLFARGDQRAPETAMLGLLQPLLDDDDPGEMHIEPAPAAAGDGLPAQGDFFEPVSGAQLPPPLVRLVDDYRWQPPLPRPLSFTAALDDVRHQDPLEAREEVVLGIVVHAALEELARARLPDDPARYVAERQPDWAQQAATHALSAAQADRVAMQTAAQVAGVLADPTGRWLLAARHGAHAELAVTTVVDGDAENLVFDRTFQA